IYLKIYQNRKEEKNRIWAFWKTDFPLTMHKHRKPMLFALVTFLLFFAVGFLVSWKDEGVARSFFGDNYIDTTIENIENGNPFGIYESGNPILSWIMLMIHNIKVSLTMFVAGIFACLPSIYLLSQNAAMVGIFDQFFAAQGLGIEFFL